MPMPENSSSPFLAIVPRSSPYTPHYQSLLTSRDQSPTPHLISSLPCPEKNTIRVQITKQLPACSWRSLSRLPNHFPAFHSSFSGPKKNQEHTARTSTGSLLPTSSHSKIRGLGTNAPVRTLGSVILTYIRSNLGETGNKEGPQYRRYLNVIKWRG